jgi:dihydrofolate reductase
MFGTLKIHHIVAASKNNVIGRGGAMPWHLKEDFKFFKETTMGHVMIMGRKTWDSIGRALPGRFTIVVSRRPEWELKEGNTLVVPSLDDAFRWCQDHTAQWGQDVFIVGGGELYRSTLNIADSVYLTRIDLEIDGDTFYPTIDESQFERVSSTPGISSDPSFVFLRYKRRTLKDS